MIEPELKRCQLLLEETALHKPHLIGDDCRQLQQGLLRSDVPRIPQRMLVHGGQSGGADWLASTRFEDPLCEHEVAEQ